MDADFDDFPGSMPGRLGVVNRTVGRSHPVSYVDPGGYGRWRTVLYGSSKPKQNASLATYHYP